MSNLIWRQQMLIEIKLLASICIVIEADSKKTGAIHAMYEKNEHFQRNSQNFTTQKCISQKQYIALCSI